MKLFPLSFCAPLLAAFTSLAAAPVAADSRISAVTVYADRAVVTRTATLDLTAVGTIEVSFDQLPAALVDQSLQVAGQGSAHTTLLDVTARPIFVDFTPNDRVKALEDALRELKHQDRTLADRVAVLGQQRDYVLKIQNATTAPPKEGGGTLPSPDSWAALLQFSADQLAKVAAEVEAIDGQREDLQARRTALEQQLNELRGEGGRSYKTVTVRLAATTAGQVEIVLRYAVPGASWTPAYDARALSAEPTVQLGYFGLVRQNTGEDWKGVDLTLSTARPSLGGGAPELQPWVVQQRQFLPAPAVAGDETITLSPFAVDAAKDKSYARNTFAGTKLRTQVADIASAVASVETQATSATFQVSSATDIPADNAPHKVSVAIVTLKAELNYQATPKLLPAAFLTAKVANSSDYPLLAGALNVFLDDTFVASSTLATVMPGEKFDLALGADEAIAVKRKLNNRFTEDTGLVNKGRRITYDYTLTVQNNKKSPEKITLLDQIPVSRHEKIVVKVLAPDEREARPATDGTLKWALALHPGEKREIPLKFSVEYPHDLVITGLE